MPSMSRNSATDCGYEMHHTRSTGPPRIRNSRHAAKLRREKPRLRGPIIATRATPRGRATDIETRPRYHSGCPHHDVATSTTTATAQTHRTAVEIGHDAQPVQRHAQPLELTCSTLPGAAVGSVCCSVGIDDDSVRPRATSAMPHAQIPVKVFARRVVAQARCVANHPS